MISYVKQIVLLSMTLVLAGCATLTNDATQDIYVRSEPSEATVTVDCGSAPLYGGVTPVTVTLERKATPCALTIARDGYAEEHVVLKRELACPPDRNAIKGSFGALMGLNLNTDDEISLCWAPGNFYDRHTGAGYKHVPGSVFVKLHPLGSV